MEIVATSVSFPFAALRHCGILFDTSEAFCSPFSAIFLSFWLPQAPWVSGQHVF